MAFCMLYANLGKGEFALVVYGNEDGYRSGSRAFVLCENYRLSNISSA